MNRFEYMQYQIAEKRLQDLKVKHARELQEAYDGIHPTRSAVDSDLGVIYVESIDPAEYAAYLVDLQAEHERIERYWSLRADVYKRALSKLSEQELDILNGNLENHGDREEIRKTVKNIVTDYVKSKPELKKKPIASMEEIEEYDKSIENMDKRELLKNYVDPLETETLKKRCIRLRDAEDMSFKNLGIQLGITSARAKQIIVQHELSLGEKELIKWKKKRLP